MSFTTSRAVWHLLRGSTVLFASSLVNGALGVLYTFAAARLLAPADYGELVALLSIAGLLGAPAGTVQTVVARFAALVSGEDALARFRTTAGHILLFAAIGTIVLVLVGIAGSGWLSRFLHLNHLTSAYWLIPLLVGVLLLPILRGLIQGFCRFGTLASLTVVDIAFKVLLGLALVALGYGSAGAIAAMAVGVVAGLLLSSLALRDFLRLPGEPTQSGLVAEMARFSVPTVCVSGGLMALTMLDTILARHYLTPEESGAYASVAVIGRSLFWVSGAVAAAILPLAARRQADASGSLLWPAVALTGGVALCGVLVLQLFPDLVLGLLFGTRYASAAYLLPIYAWAAFLLCLGNVIVNYLLGRGRGSAAFPVLAALTTFAVLALIWHEDATQLIHNLVVAGVVLVVSLVPVVRASEAGARTTSLPARPLTPAVVSAPS